MYGVSADFYHSNLLDAFGWLIIAAVCVSSIIGYFITQRVQEPKCYCMIMQEKHEPKIAIQSILTVAYCILLAILLSAGNVFEESTSDRLFLKGNAEAWLITAICLLLMNKIAAHFIRYSQFWKKILFLTAGILGSVISGILWELNFAIAGATWLFFAGLAFYGYWTYPRRHEDL